MLLFQSADKVLLANIRFWRLLDESDWNSFGAADKY
jgi:hypothetical protein